MPKITRKNKGHKNPPQIIFIDGHSKLIIATTSVNSVKLLVCYNANNMSEKFNLITVIPDAHKGKILISAPIPIETAWILYCSFSRWVPQKDLPEDIWADYKDD